MYSQLDYAVGPTDTFTTANNLKFMYCKIYQTKYVFK